jgi:acetyl-CoA carboxylase alpha subunit
MRIKRLTITLPNRLRGSAEQQARQIAQAVAEQVDTKTSHQLSVELDGHGASGPALANAVGSRLAATSRGRR